MPVGITHSNPGMKMVIVIPLQLNMSAGKVASQAAHAAMVAGLKAQGHEGFVQWLLGGMRKVVVETPLVSDLYFLNSEAQKAGFVTHLVEDEGHTEVAFGSATALAIGPAHSGQLNAITGHLNMLGHTFNPLARIKELEAINEQHRQMNGQLRQELDAAKAGLHGDFCCGMMGTYAGDSCPGERAAPLTGDQPTNG